jgi:hypothetical protein
MLNKARRGELKTALPAGFVYDAQDRIVLDPDRQVQQAVRLLFQTFRRVGTATAMVRAFREQGILFPRRARSGPTKGQILWTGLHENRALLLLRNPFYAGVYVFGRTRQRITPDGRRRIEKLPRDQWYALIKDDHIGYISWQEYEENQLRLRDNAAARGVEHRTCPPREGPALLQGLVLCGICGAGMSPRYHAREERLVPEYVCRGRGNKQAEPKCQSIPGAGVDDTIGRLLVEAVTPMALEVALAVQEELRIRFEEADNVRRQQVERARYEAELARRRYMRIDPDNRLVADELEADWNAKLRALNDAQQDYERRREADGHMMDEQTRTRILALANDFSKLWSDERTPDRERKRMVRLLLQDVTLLKKEDITIHVRFRGGVTKTLNIPKSLNAWLARKTPTRVVTEIDRLLDEHTDGEVATLLNQQGLLSGEGKPFDGRRIAVIRRAYKLRSRYARLRDRGYLTLLQMAAKLGVSTWTVKEWRIAGRITGYPANDMGQCLYDSGSISGGSGARATGRRDRVRSR